MDNFTLFFVGERRIRVHTMCLPVTNQLSEVMAGADQQAIVCLLSRMGKSVCILSWMGNSNHRLQRKA